MDSPHIGPAMQKASIMQFQSNRFTFVLSIPRKNNFTQQRHQMSVRVFYLIGNSTFVQQPAHKAWKNTSKLCPLFWSAMGKSTSDQWNPHTKKQQCEKRPSCNFMVEHVYMCVTSITERQIIQNGDRMWASRDFTWLATVIVCSTSHIGKMKQKNKILHYWSSMWKTHWWPMVSPYKGFTLQMVRDEWSP